MKFFGGIPLLAATSAKAETFLGLFFLDV